MKADNSYKKERLYNKAIKKAEEREKKGFYKRAALAYIEASKFLLKEHLEKHSICLAKAGCYYDEAGEYNLAKKAYQDALSIMENITPPNLRLISNTLNDLGVVVMNLGEYSESEGFYNQALTIRKKILGEKHPNTLQTLNNLSAAYYYQGEFDKAIKSAKAVLAEQKKIFNDDNLAIALTLYNLGNTYHANGDYKIAFDYAEKSLLIRKKLLPPQHELIAGALSILGNIYLSVNNIELAEKNHNEALNMLENLLGYEHPKLVVCLNSLGGIYRAQGNKQQAIDYYQRALSISKKTSGNEHPEVAMFLMNLGSIYADNNEIDTAEKCFQQALTIQEKKLDKDHPYIGMLFNNLGELYFSKGDNKKAEEYFSFARQILTKSLQSGHPYNKEIEKNYKNLQDKIARLEREKLEKRAALHKSERLAYLGQMATMMAHNINNPVGIIRMIASGGLGDLNDNLFNPETDLKPLLEKIILQTERLSVMMVNFRKFSRGNRKQLTAMNLNELIDDIFQLLFDAPYQIERIKMLKDFYEPAPLAHSNEFAIQEMLISLLSNAREAVKEQSIKNISIKTWRHEESVGFNIEDSGKGISAEQQPQLFTPFLSSKSEGMGLGLYFCREIVKDLGGSIEYYPAALGGAGFKITLPIQQEVGHGVSI
ncbi:MAG: tetratricopeptide repeat protein [Methyloprofundus sp.]|nr:tetratricopeptide repeat protein [Methyloprofundus sp.]